MKQKTYGLSKTALYQFPAPPTPALCLEALSTYKNSRCGDLPSHIDYEITPDRKFPGDGTYEWFRETDCDPLDLGCKPRADYMRVKYTEGPLDRAWMQERDRNYLTRLAKKAEALLPSDASLNDPSNLISTTRERVRTLAAQVATYDFATYERIEKQLLDAKERLPGIIAQAKSAALPKPSASEIHAATLLAGKVEAQLEIYAAQANADTSYISQMQTYLSKLSNLAEYTQTDLEKVMRDLESHQRSIKDLIAASQGSSASSATSSGGAAAAAAAIPQTGLQEIAHDALNYGDVLGEGGFGTVYQGTWQHSTVAIKQLKQQSLTEDSVAELHAEATVMSQLHNPHIVQFYGFCFESPHFALVMEYMPDGSMYGLLHSDHPLTWDARTQMGIDVGAGLEYLHQQDILHRDLKSMNVLLYQQAGAYRCKLTDFGLSKVKTETKLTTTVGGKGTLAWMAPELFGRRAVYAKASDVYSYAVVLWELASRATPFSDAHDPALIGTWVREGEREDIPSDTPAAMIDAISQGWAQDAASRLTAIQIVDLLRASQTHAEPAQQQQQVQQQTEPKQPQAKAGGVAGNLASQRPKAAARGKVAGNLASFKPAAGKGMPVAKRGAAPKSGVRPKSGMLPKRGAAPKRGPGLFQANLASVVAKQATGLGRPKHNFSVKPEILSQGIESPANSNLEADLAATYESTTPAHLTALFLPPPPAEDDSYSGEYEESWPESGEGW